MLSSIGGWIEDKAAGYLRTGIQAGGTLAGNTVGSVGNMMENAGRSAGDGVSGKIGGVGGVINGYGDGIKRSMSSDGPVSASEKKTAVKPTAPTERKTPTAPKTLPSAGGVKKTPPASQRASAPVSMKPKTIPKPAGQAQKAPGAVTPKPFNTNMQSNVKKPATNLPKTVSSVRSDGKVRIAAESRPRSGPTTATTRPLSTGGAKKHDSSDPIGIGQNFSDISKSGPTKFKDMKSRGPPGKPSAADPLALGEEIGNIGKKK